MKKLIILYIASAFSFACGQQLPKQIREPEITAAEIKEHITYLASDEMKGRLTGSQEIEKAAEYIESEFKSYGLIPLFDGKFTQTFSFISDAEAGSNNSLIIKYGSQEKVLKLSEDFIPMSFSGNGNVSGSLVFAGYGISAPELQYDDYAGLDVKNKIVIVLRYNPEFDNPHSDFENYSAFRKKASVAKEKGAAGIIFINGFYPKTEEDDLQTLKYDRAAGIKDFPAVNVKREIIADIFSSSGKDLKALQEKMNKDKAPSSFLLENATVELTADINYIEKNGLNVAGYLKGTDPVLSGEYIIIGAHFDHLGMGAIGSLYKGKDEQIHNGADDNASGTTGLLELAEKFAADSSSLKRNIVFVAFSGEEYGLLGSNYFVEDPPVPLNKMAAMINMDMIGRMDDKNTLIVYGTGTSAMWSSLLTEKNKYDFKLSFTPDGFGPSDHSSFYAKQIPVLFFFTGTHTDYHRPSDDAGKINIDKEEAILKYVYDVVSGIDSNPLRPGYVSVPRKEGSANMQFRVYVGTIPDYSATEGFKINGVAEGSPAQKAGMLSGDVIVEFGGKRISSIYDYMYAMNEHTPGDVVEVVVQRGEDKVKLSVELAAR